jgi:hypothetical protein
VAFNHLSLEDQLAALAPASVDVVFFRNVAIYLSPSALERMYAGLERVLKSEGLLVVGLADPPPRSSAFARTGIPGTLVYQRAKPPKHKRPASVAVSPPRRAQRSHELSSHSERDRAATIAHNLADRGLMHEALSSLEESLGRLGSSAKLLGLKGRILLAAGDAQNSVLDLQGALLLQPTDLVLRFHYALGLEVLHQRELCGDELRQLLQKLEGRRETEALDDSDASITVKSLRQAAHELLRRVE